MTSLIDMKQPRQRFARSVNVERDAGSEAVDGYMPVGRALEAISRLAAALDRPEGEVAISITGPYGSGKSSLAVVIDALLGPAKDASRHSAEELLADAAPRALAQLDSARRRLGAHQHGFVRAIATAQREPIAATALRALTQGAERYRPTARQKANHARVLSQLRALRDSFAVDRCARPSTRDIRNVVADLSGVAPVLLLIDEFGKNLEAFTDSRSDADLYLLQELAEWTRGQHGIPLALITLQHMAFDEYAEGATATQRREWLKIQGRFEDVPFVDSPAQTRSLISAAFDPPAKELEGAARTWAAGQSRELKKLGLNDLAVQSEVIAACWPLHPLALLALPELCERYGQNERTLFSFLAGPEPLSVATFLAEHEWDATAVLPSVRLDRVYDYFLESATGLAGISNAASRWVEIDSRIRDAHGLDDASRRVLKTVGLLNLVSAGGTLRASRAAVMYAAADGQSGTKTPKQVEARLSSLEADGLVTFRDFADEFRVWQGSDFDLRAAVDQSRRRLREDPPASILNNVLPLGPLVAARHSYEKGVLRAFAREWIDPSAQSIDPLPGIDPADGCVLYVLGSRAPTTVSHLHAESKPIVFRTIGEPSSLIEAAREVAALDEVLASTEDLGDDWVARRELVERRVEARASLDREFELACGVSASSGSKWIWAVPVGQDAGKWSVHKATSASLALSRVADAWFWSTPVIHNDIANRHELSSQAAKARRLLIEAMLAAPDQPDLGIDGFGPERTLYLTVLRDLGIHGPVDGVITFTEPAPGSAARPVWDRIAQLLRDAVTGRIRVSDIYERLAAPPFGLRAGVAPILLVAALIVYADDVALYEHGTFRPVLSSDVCERLLRNPANFEVKHFAARSGSRARLLTLCADSLGIVQTTTGGRKTRVRSVLAVLSHLVALVNALPEYSRKTHTVETATAAVRRALLQATEPDRLLFHALPEALGYPPVPAKGAYAAGDLEAIASTLGDVAASLRSAYPQLLSDVRDALREELRGPAEGLRENLAVRARDLQGQLIDQRLARLAVALGADLDGDDEWAEYVAMNVAGTPPATWSDDDRRRFFSLLHDIGGTFRRIEVLNADVRSRDEGFEAMRVTVTRADGAETARLVWFDETRREALGDVLEAALEQVRPLADTDAEARDLLLALLAENDLRPVDVSQLPRTGDATPYSGSVVSDGEAVHE